MFRFKQFTVEDNLSTMKVGTDAVLLGCIAGGQMHDDEETPIAILDIGTGCGVIALMMAQRFPNALVDAVDIDKESAAQAFENFRKSNWKERLHCYTEDIRTWGCKRRYDIIVSNPPYFSNSLHSASYRRNRARHDDNLPMSELVSAVLRLMKDHGSFWCIMPCLAAEKMITEAEISGLHCKQKIEISNLSGGEPIRIIFELTKNSQTGTEMIQQYLRDADGERSLWHRTISQDFYL